VVRQCKAKGVKGVVAFTGGFSETGSAAGRALEAELKKQFDGSIRMIGPNCLGVYSPGGGVTQHPGEGYSQTGGDVAFVARAAGSPRTSAVPRPTSAFNAAKW